MYTIFSLVQKNISNKKLMVSDVYSVYVTGPCNTNHGI